MRPPFLQQIASTYDSTTQGSPQPRTAALRTPSSHTDHQSTPQPTCEHKNRRKIVKHRDRKRFWKPVISCIITPKCDPSDPELPVLKNHTSARILQESPGERSSGECSKATGHFQIQNPLTALKGMTKITLFFTRLTARFNFERKTEFRTLHHPSTRTAQSTTKQTRARTQHVPRDP